MLQAAALGPGSFSICEVLELDRKIARKGYLPVSTADKMDEWRDHLEGLLRSLCSQLVEFRNISKLQVTSLDSSGNVGQTRMLEGIQNLVEKTCEWHKGIGELKLSFKSCWYHPQDPASHPLESVRVDYRRNHTARRMRIRSETLEDPFGEGSEGVLSGSFMQAVLGMDDLKITEAETMVPSSSG